MSAQPASLAEEETCGVALLLFNTEGKIFCVKELIEKEVIGKHRGDYSFPWETKQGGESDEETLKRLLEEEVHGEAAVEISSPEYVGAFTVVPGTQARIYQAWFLQGPSILKGLHEGIEVEALGWQTKEFLLSHCRTGVERALELFDQYQKKGPLPRTLA